MVRSSNALALMKALVAAAWADSELSQSELNYIKELARRFQLGDEEWFELQPYLEDPVPDGEQEAILQDLLSRIGSAGERTAVLEHLHRIIEADGNVSETERVLLARYREILERPSSLDLMLGRLKTLFRQAPADSGPDIDEFLRNKILFKLRRRIGDDQITADMHRMALLGGLMGIVAQADGEIDEGELEEIRRQLADRGQFDDEALDLLVAIIQEESVRGLDRHRLIHEYSGGASLEERVALLDTLFAVAASDGALTHGELEELRAVSSALNLSHKQYINAKVRAR